MIKNIIIGVLAVVLTFFAVLANIKAKEAEKQVLQAERKIKMAEENAILAKKMEGKALTAAAMAKKAADDLKLQLENCK